MREPDSGANATFLLESAELSREKYCCALNENNQHLPSRDEHDWE